MNADRPIDFSIFLPVISTKIIPILATLAPSGLYIRITLTHLLPGVAYVECAGACTLTPNIAHRVALGWPNILQFNFLSDAQLSGARAGAKLAQQSLVNGNYPTACAHTLTAKELRNCTRLCVKGFEIGAAHQ